MSESTNIAGKPVDGESWDVIIVGSGPSGLTAAIYTTRGAASTLIIGGEKWGGQLMLTTEVDNFPAHPGIQGPDLMTKMRDHAMMFGAEFVDKNVISISFDEDSKLNIVKTADSEYKSKSIIISTGSETKWLGVPGERELIGRGVSTCAPCDAPFFKDKKVVVVGGGDSAMEESLVLAKYATQVILVHRRDEFKASKAMQKRVFENEKIDIVWDTGVVEVLGDQTVKSIKLRTSKDSTHLESVKNEKLAKHSGKILEEENDLVWEIPTDGVFVAIGHSPSTEVFGEAIELDEKGYVVVRDRTRTSRPGVFVSGDVHDYHYKQAITAAGFGCMAGMDALKYLEDLKE